MKGRTMKHRACWLLALLSPLSGCASHMDEVLGLPPAPPRLGAAIERAGRPLTGNALVGLFAAEDVSNRRKEQYNRAAPADWSQFVPDIERGLGFYDGFDGRCGNQWLVDRDAAPAARYRALASLLADDRLWIDSRSTVCTQLFGVELAALGGPGSPSGDCGGRTPNVDAVDVFRSLLALGRTGGLEDGVDRDDRVHSTTEFPFLATP